MIRVRITRKGVALWGMQACIRRIAPRVQIGIMAAGQVLLEESRKLVPVDTKALIESSGVRKIDSGIFTKARVFYGRFGDRRVAVDKHGRLVTREPYWYAAAVHQVDAHHDVGQWRYLIDPRDAKRNEMRAALLQAIR
jgi:hypothetical protein